MNCKVQSMIFLAFFTIINCAYAKPKLPANTTFETATYVNEERSFSGIVTSDEQIQYYVAGFKKYGDVKVYVTITNLDSRTSTYQLQCFDQQKDDGYAGRIRVGLEPGQTYRTTLEINGLNIEKLYFQSFSYYGTFKYTISFSIVNRPAIDQEPNDGQETASLLMEKKTVSGNVGYIKHIQMTDIGSPGFDRDEFDVYKIVPKEDGNINLHLRVTRNERYYSNLRVSVTDKDYYHSLDEYVPDKGVGTTADTSFSFECKANDTLFVWLEANAAFEYTLGFNADNLPVKLTTIDPNPYLIEKDGSINKHPVLAGVSDEISAAAADGITRLLITANSGTPLHFSVEKGNGTLASLHNQNQSLQELTVEPDSAGRVIAVYRVPDGYGNRNITGSGVVSVTVSDQNAADRTSSKTIRIVTPPVVLVHGMWSSPEAWLKGGFSTYLEAAGISHIYLANYAAFSSSTFDPNSIESWQPRLQLQAKIEEALTDYHRMGIAAAQVDVVGHSLGGLMTRSFSQQPEFLAERNYFKGFVHKLITMGTPHRGSPLGPEVWKLRDKLVYFKIPEIEFSVPLELSTLFDFISMPIGSCHRDFGITSQGIANLSNTLPYKTFAITASHEGDGVIPGEITPYLVMQTLCKVVFNKTFGEIFQSRCNTKVLPNDLIVPYKSQTGYISSTQAFYGTSHSLPGFLTETNNPLIQQKVSSLLLSNDTTLFSRGFPAPNSFPLEDCDNAAQRVVQPVPRLNKAENLRIKDGIQMLSPSKGQVVNPLVDSTLDVQYSVSTGIKVKQAMIMIENLGWYNLALNTSYRTKISLPRQLPQGQLHVMLLLTDEQDRIFADTGHILLLPSGQLLDVAVTPSSIFLDSVIRESQITLQKSYATDSGIIRRLLFSRAHGVSYMSNYGDSIIRISPDGNVTAMHPGVDTITVSDSDNVSRIPVTVAENFLRGKYFSNSLNFPAIADQMLKSEFFIPEATVSSGEKVLLRVISGPIEVINGVVYLKATGHAVIEATAPGNAYFSHADTIRRSFEIVDKVLASDQIQLKLQSQDSAVSLIFFVASPAAFKNFWIERSVEGRTFENLATVTADGSGRYLFSDAKLPRNADKIIYYRVRGLDADGQFILSNTSTIKTSGTEQVVYLYPNPANRSIFIKIPEGQELCLFQLYDQLGKTVMQKKLTSGLHQAGLPVLSTGTYNVVLTNKKGKTIFSKPLVINQTK